MLEKAFNDEWSRKHIRYTIKILTPAPTLLLQLVKSVNPHINFQANKDKGQITANV